MSKSPGLGSSSQVQRLVALPPESTNRIAASSLSGSRGEDGGVDRTPETVRHGCAGAAFDVGDVHGTDGGDGHPEAPVLCEAPATAYGSGSRVACTHPAFGDQ